MDKVRGVDRGRIGGVIEVASLVLFAAEPEKTADFYRVAGIALEEEDHGEGPVHFAAEVGGVHVAIYPAGSSGRAPTIRQGGSSFPGFYVDSLDAVTAELTPSRHRSWVGMRRCRGVAGSSSRIQTGDPWKSTSVSTVPSSRDDPRAERCLLRARVSLEPAVRALGVTEHSTCGPPTLRRNCAGLSRPPGVRGQVRAEWRSRRQNGHATVRRGPFWERSKTMTKVHD